MKKRKNKRKSDALLTSAQIAFITAMVALALVVTPDLSNLYWQAKAATIAGNMAVVAEADDQISFAHRAGDDYYRLSETDKAVYDAIVDQSLRMLNGEDYVKTIVFGFDYELSGVKSVYHALRHDCSWLIWWGVNLGWEAQKGENSFTLYLRSPYDDENGQIRKDALEKAAASIANAAKFAKQVENEDEITQLKLFSNYAAQCTKYDFDVAKDYWCEEESFLNAKNFVSVFDGDESTKSICTGYANAFQLLCFLNGIECYWVYGYVNNRACQHAWNKVVIDGQQDYLFDITFADGTLVDNTFMLTPVEGSVYTAGSQEYHEIELN